MSMYPERINHLDTMTIVGGTFRVLCHDEEVNMFLGDIVLQPSSCCRMTANQVEDSREFKNHPKNKRLCPLFRHT